MKYAQGKALIFADCDNGAYGLVPSGKHKVKFRAELPGTDRAIETSPIEIDLACEAGAGQDSSTVDNPVQEAADSGAKPVETAAVPTSNSDGEASCSVGRVVGTQAVGSSAALFVAAVAVFLRRRSATASTSRQVR